MKTLKAWSILAAGWLVAGCATGRQAPAPVGSEPTARAGTPTAFPAEPSTSVDEGRSATAESDVAPAAAPPATAAPSPGDAALGRSGAGSPRAEASRSQPKKSSAPMRMEEERPGLGTTWGEARTSRVSNAPFERASESPFSLSTLHYNDQSGISAMLRGGSLVDFRSDGAVGNGFLTVRLTDENGSTLPTFQSNGRTLTQGEVGQRYMISISNQSSNRFEAVVTVDGLDVMDGRAGSFAKRGYLVQPFGSVEIDGFRTSMDEVAAFRFGSVRGSYAAQKGNDRNVGVVGVAFFAERGARQVWNDRELSRRENADAFPGRFATPAR